MQMNIYGVYILRWTRYLGEPEHDPLNNCTTQSYTITCQLSIRKILKGIYRKNIKISL